MSGLRFLVKDSGRALILVSRHNPTEAAWRWSVVWDWRGWRRDAAAGRRFMVRADRRQNQWHDYYGPLIVSRQDYHLRGL